MSLILEVEGLNKSFGRGGGLFRRTERTHVTRNVSFTLGRGETLGIVGESGAGKSTVGRQVLRLVEPDSGRIVFDGKDLLSMKRRELGQFRQRAQMIFQDPFSSLDPHMTVRDSVGEPLRIHSRLNRVERDEKVLEAIRRVGLRSDQLLKYPKEFSGGQLQRIAIARALITNPDMIVCDEPVAALDLSIQAQVLNLLIELQAERGLSYLFVSHDLSLVRFLAHRVAVMYRGEIVEMASAEEIFENPQHEYTKKLISAMPKLWSRKRAAVSNSMVSSPAADATSASNGSQTLVKESSC